MAHGAAALHSELPPSAGKGKCEERKFVMD